jgi:release factor glutamine methyltransferase
MKKLRQGTETLLPLLRSIYDRFKKARVFNPYVTAEVIISEALGIPRAEIYLAPEKKVRKSQIEKVLRWTSLREKRTPLSYILHKTWFREIELEITPAVLVPRQETELLVDEAIKLIKAEPKIAKILDLGTGSGAIILSLAHELKDLGRPLKLFASDLSAPALKIAQKNARKLGLDKIFFRRGDWLAPFRAQKFDLIICNPPYIQEKELPRLMPEVSKYEPRLALDGGSQGLEQIKRILATAPAHLNPSGFLLFEIGKGQSSKLASISSPRLELKKFAQDYQHIDRIALFQYCS